MTGTHSAERFDMLDAWRGIAASVVVLNHVTSMGFGYQAVLLFFVISGYCITASMEACLRENVGFRGFMGRRIRRIYPPYLLAVTLFVLARSVRAALVGDPLGWPILPLLQNLTLTQWVSLLADPVPLPAANPALFLDVFWSLCYEEQFYFVMALVMLIPAAATRRWVLAGLMALGLAWMLLMPRLCHGIFIEYWPEFGIGSLLFYRLCRMPSRATRMATDLFLAAMAIAGWLAHAHFETRLGAQRPIFGELFVVSAFALLLVITRPLNDIFRSSRIGRALMWLGVISYSLYLVHPIFVHVIARSARLLLPVAAPEWALVSAQLALHLAAAFAFWIACERPFLNRPLVPDAQRPVSHPVSRSQNLSR